jgi:hypothetical protein
MSESLKQNKGEKPSNLNVKSQDIPNLSNDTVSEVGQIVDKGSELLTDSELAADTLQYYRETEYYYRDREDEGS